MPAAVRYVAEPRRARTARGSSAAVELGAWGALSLLKAPCLVHRSTTSKSTWKTQKPGVRLFWWIRPRLVGFDLSESGCGGKEFAYLVGCDDGSILRIPYPAGLACFIGLERCHSR
jgi:hypothetical protein